jgi:DNA-binding PadR family transcriptional regulator
MTDLILLATLLPGPRHGYHLKRQAGFILGEGPLHNNLVYPQLRSFMKQKWVTRKPVPGERGQTRLQYALTALGRKELIARVSTFNEQDARSSSAFRFRVSMFELLEAEVRARILDLREEFLRSRIARLATIQENFELGVYAAEVTSQLRGDTQSELRWLSRLRKLTNKSGAKE